MELGRGGFPVPQVLKVLFCSSLYRGRCLLFGVQAILSQCCPKDNKIHPCAFFSRKLSPVEQNDNVGNQELLAVKLASKEWRHWLEGVAQPFLVWTDHKSWLQKCQAEREDNPSTPATILPSPCVIRAVTWGIVDEVRRLLEGVEIPEGCPRIIFLSCPHTGIH